MNAKDEIIEKIAGTACEKITRRVIRQLQQMTQAMQSGDDSPLKNIWDEICVQVQHEESIMWDDYIDIVLWFIKEEVKKINVEIKQCLWLQTDAAIDREEDHVEQEIIEFNEDDIADYVLHNNILSMAGDWNNKRIEKYLESESDFDW